MSPAPLHLTLTGITHRYGPRRRPVLEGLDLSFDAAGTVLLGPNGAGKSTLLAVAGSILRPAAGEVSLDGLTPRRRADRCQFRRVVGWLPQSVEAIGGLTVREQVALHAWLAGLSKRDAWDQARHALDLVALADALDRKATALSGGQRARMGLAQALAKDARVLLLDEPTAALDPDQRERFSSLLREISPGRTVVVSTHDVNDLAEVYDRVVVLDRGAVRFDGTTSGFLVHASPNGTSRDPVAAYRAIVGAR